MELNLEKLQQVFNTAFGQEVKIDLTTSKENTELWDSFNHLNLIIELEDIFTVKYSKEEIESMLSVSSIIEITQRKIGNV